MRAFAREFFDMKKRKSLKLTSKKTLGKEIFNNKA